MKDSVPANASGAQKIAHAVLPSHLSNVGAGPFPQRPWETKFTLGLSTPQNLWQAKFGGPQLGLFYPSDNMATQQGRTAITHQGEEVDLEIGEESDDEKPIAFGFSDLSSTGFQQALRPGEQMPEARPENTAGLTSQHGPKKPKYKPRVKKNVPLESFSVWQEYKEKFEVASSPVEEPVNLSRPRNIHGTSKCGCRQCIKSLTQEGSKAGADTGQPLPDSSNSDQSPSTASSASTLAPS